MFRASLDSIRQDAVFALRTFRRSRAFTAAALLTLALGIGANTAVFSVVNGILLKPLPYPEPSKLVAIWPGHFASAAELLYLQQHATSYVGGAAAFSPGWGVTLSDPAASFHLSGARASSNFFRMLGVKPSLGRTFLDGESAPGSDHVVLLSHALWRTRFGADSAIVGRDITFDNESYRVVGVMPAGFSIFQEDAELWMPFQTDPASPFYKGGVAFLVGRLGPRTTMGAAKAELQALIPDMRSALDLEKTFGHDMSVIPLEIQIVGNLRPMLLVLLGAVGFIVLIAGANVGNLLLARAGFRQQEMAVRSALGANRTRLIRQLLSESVILAGCGGILGFALGVGGVRALKTVLPANLPRLNDVTVDLRVLVVCAAVTLVVGLIFGLAPAWIASGHDLQGTLRAGRAGERVGFGRRARGALVVSEVALSVVLVIGAGLMIETMWRISRVDPGFRATNILTVRVQPSGPGYESRERREQYLADILEQVRATPGVEVAGATLHLPLSGFDWHRDTDIEGKPAEPGATPFRPGWRTVAGDYFKAMAIPLKRGRTFEARDVVGSPGVVVINEAFARNQFASDNPIGRRLVLKGGSGTDSVTIIGVVGDVRHTALTTPAEPEIFLSEWQFPRGAMAIVARTTGDPMKLARTIRERVAAVDRTVPISDPRALDQLVSSSEATPRVVMFLLVAFAGVGLVLGAVGIYGVVNYAVSSRVREIGIRIALGAARASVAGHVVREGVGYAVVGVVAGVAAAAALSRAMQTLLFGVSPTDAVVYLSVSLALLLTAAIASYLPARRAAGIDPVAALRAD